MGNSDLGVHVDGYVALVATTVVVGSGPVTGRAADAIMACKTAGDVIIRMLQPGSFLCFALDPDWCDRLRVKMSRACMLALHSQLDGWCKYACAGRQVTRWRDASEDLN